MGAVLAGAENPVDFLRGGVVTADDFGAFGGEPEFSRFEGEAVRAAQCAKVDNRQSFLRLQIRDSDGVERATAVIGNVRKAAIIGSDDFMGIRAGRKFCQDRERCGITMDSVWSLLPRISKEARGVSAACRSIAAAQKRSTAIERLRVILFFRPVNAIAKFKNVESLRPVRGFDKTCLAAYFTAAPGLTKNRVLSISAGTATSKKPTIISS